MPKQLKYYPINTIILYLISAVALIVIDTFYIYTPNFNFMKLKLTILTLVLITTQVYSQTKNTLSLMYAPGSGNINIHSAIGDFGYVEKPSKSFGLSYTRQLNKIVSFETGLRYSQNDIEESVMSDGGGPGRLHDQLNMVSIPLLAKLTFLKYLYVDMGFDVDFQTNYSDASIAPSQSGIALEAGVGAKYSYKSIMLFICPYLQYHSLTRFGSNKGQDFELMNTGVKFGLGYNF
jgi:uncharacterized metal-binding protein